MIWLRCNVLVLISIVVLHWVRPVLRWVTIHGYTIFVYKPTQPDHPSICRHNEFWPWTGLSLAKKRRVLRHFLFLFFSFLSWYQRPLVSIACLVMSCHSLRSRLFSSRSPVSHQLMISSIHPLHGLPLLFVPSTIPNISVFICLLSSILHMWLNSHSFLCMTLCMALCCSRAG